MTAICIRVRSFLRRALASAPHPMTEQVSNAGDTVVREAGRLEREVDRNNFSLLVKGIHGDRRHPGQRQRRKT